VVVGGIVYCNCKPFTRGISFDSSNAVHKMRTLYIIQIIATILILLKIKAVIEIISCFLGQLSSFISTSPSIRDSARLENITLFFLTHNTTRDIQTVYPINLALLQQFFNDSQLKQVLADTSFNTSHSPIIGLTSYGKSFIY
jgi:hypothetical protein